MKIAIIGAIILWALTIVKTSPQYGEDEKNLEINTDILELYKDNQNYPYRKYSLGYYK